MELSEYEQRVVDEIEQFKAPEDDEPGVLDEALEAVEESVSSIGERLSDNATVEELLESPAAERLSASADRARDEITEAVRKTVGLLNDSSAYTVDRQGIYEKFREAGFEEVDSPADIREIPLERIDELVASTSSSYKSTAFAEGGASGAAGVAGLAADIPALVGIALRAINEYTTYYGTDIDDDHERTVALHILLASSSTSEADRQTALAQLTKASMQAAREQPREEVDDALSAADIDAFAEQLGIRLIRAKLAQTVPVVGAAVAGGYNAWYLSAVTETAQMTYRERYLVDRYGPEAHIGGEAVKR
jgi:hypothetical protein